VDVELSEEQRFLQQTVAKFLEHAVPLSALRERAERDEPPFTRAYWGQAAELGLAAVLVPEEFGGIGTEQPVLDLVIVAEEMGRQIAPGPLLPVSVVTDALPNSSASTSRRWPTGRCWRPGRWARRPTSGSRRKARPARGPTARTGY
jgi:alkylation response protein AidB-like acyl-CoA dehydrogenase